MLAGGPCALAWLGSGSSLGCGSQAAGVIPQMGVEHGRRSRHAGICTWSVYNGLHCNAGRFPVILDEGPGLEKGNEGREGHPTAVGHVAELGYQPKRGRLGFFGQYASVWSSCKLK